jgi:hypothetical protein
MLPAGKRPKGIREADRITDYRMSKLKFYYSLSGVSFGRGYYGITSSDWPLNISGDKIHLENKFNGLFLYLICIRPKTSVSKLSKV